MNRPRLRTAVEHAQGVGGRNRLLVRATNEEATSYLVASSFAGQQQF